MEEINGAIDKLDEAVYRMDSQLKDSLGNVVGYRVKNVSTDATIYKDLSTSDIRDYIARHEIIGVVMCQSTGGLVGEGYMLNSLPIIKV